ncbi:MAG: Gfo/Idh/MocA family oxidoreductase [Candidatus Hydrogenedentes bacterium]|nr:Gfo/Idh/MocA family oxidoreductase [Candidatus Hydrogenedentota bacterium]
MKRRTFLKQVGAGVAGAAAISYTASSAAAGANERISVGIMGCQRGLLVGEQFAAQGARIAYVCDPDEGRARRAREKLSAEKVVDDFRPILDDASVDVLVVAAPDHWHGPAAILACAAGKHVYVEKPCSHNIREGRLMIDAARRANVVMQVGSQSRSTPVLADGVQQVREGAIGDVLVAKAWNSQRRVNIGHESPSDPPPGFAYDLWVGPAPKPPFQKNRHHYTWHWWYDFGTGDVGNDGIHELDIACWGLGVDTHPARVSGYGSKMHFDDDQQFPDTQYATFEYPQRASGPPRLLIYEQRIWSPYVQEGYENGNAFYGTEGYLLLSKHFGWRLFGPKNELIREEKGTYSVPDHVADFTNAIRSGKRPSADIEIGHRSATVAHLANILARAGRGTLEFDSDREQIVGDDQANAFVKRSYREDHWAVPADV